MKKRLLFVALILAVVFGAFAACSESIPMLDADTAAVLNALAPSGQTDALAYEDNYFEAVMSDRSVTAWNRVSNLTNADNALIAVYEAVKGDSSGTVIVKTKTKGFGSTPVVLFTVIGADGKFVQMQLEDTQSEAPYGQTFYDQGDIAAINEAIAGKSVSELSVKIFTDNINLIVESGATAGTTGTAFYNAVKIASAIYADVNDLEVEPEPEPEPPVTGGADLTALNALVESVKASKNETVKKSMAFAYALRTAEAAAEKENLTQFEADTLKNALQSAYYYASTEYVGQFVLSEEGEIWASNNVTNAAYKQTVSVAINHSGIITDILYELPETPTYGTSGNSGFTTQTYYDAWLNYYVDVFNDLIGKTAAEVSTYQKGTERNGGVHYIGQNPVIVSGATQTGRNFVSSVVAACNAFVDNAGNAIMSEKANLTLLIAMIEASQSENVKASVSVAKALTGAKAAVDSSAGMAAAKTALKDSHATAAGGFSDPAKFAVVEATGDTWAASRVIADDYKITLKVVFDKTNNTIADILYIPLGAHVTGDSYFTRWTTADNANRPGTYIETAAILLGKTATEVAAYTKPSGNASGGALGNGLVIVSGATETGRNLISSVAKACNVYLSPAFAGRSASIQTRNHVLIGLIAGLLALTALTVIYTVYYRKKAKA